MAKTIYPTSKKENLRSIAIRTWFNFFPAYRRTGGRICFLSDDWREMHVRLGLNHGTRNYVGSVFGGSIYGALDPIYMMQLIGILGHDYVVWDKAAAIKFIKPIKTTVYARFVITDELIDEIISKVRSNNKHVIELSTNYQDENGMIYAEVDKTLYIADRVYYNAR